MDRKTSAGVTERPAVLYRLFNEADELLYVGVGNRLEERLTYHTGSKRWGHEVVRHEAEWYPSRELALKAEALAINTEHPRYNIIIPDLDGSGRGRVNYDAPPIAWTTGDPRYRSKYRLRREARERAERNANDAA